MMKQDNTEKYLLSISPIHEMFKNGLITKKEYFEAEEFIAKKYCINKGNLYRLNDLTIPPTKVINSVTQEEVNKNEQNNNKDRSITRIT